MIKASQNSSCQGSRRRSMSTYVTNWRKMTRPQFKWLHSRESTSMTMLGDWQLQGSWLWSLSSRYDTRLHEPTGSEVMAISLLQTGNCGGGLTAVWNPKITRHLFSFERVTFDPTLSFSYIIWANQILVIQLANLPMPLDTSWETMSFPVYNLHWYSNSVQMRRPVSYLYRI